MKKTTRLICVCLSLTLFVLGSCGCEAWRTFKRDYLKADEWHKDTLKDAYNTYKNDYLKADEIGTGKSSRRRAGDRADGQWQWGDSEFFDEDIKEENLNLFY